MHGTSCIIAARRTMRSSKNDSRPSGVLMTRSTLRLTISSAMFGRPSFTLKTTPTSSPYARRYAAVPRDAMRSEEHTSELQSHHDLVCRLLLEKKKNHIHST